MAQFFTTSLSQLQPVYEVVSLLLVLEGVHQQLEGVLVDDALVQQTRQVELLEGRQHPYLDQQLHALLGQEQPPPGGELVDGLQPVLSQLLVLVEDGALQGLELRLADGPSVDVQHQLLHRAHGDFLDVPPLRGLEADQYAGLLVVRVRILEVEHFELEVLA
eukprot:CAMPEP_0173188782 /NCGR_PEP_ID=MMETSP1141-20130122/11434_1 /TAXON_ID=483371 /ORGANISM="non described non described, Strain CCMP2298" /LENGTH=161 /DNA_ID=CAMNT_0014112725 /DNA_START=329 /DNA_END=813 /DNA_ORIENTATION=+